MIPRNSGEAEEGDEEYRDANPLTDEPRDDDVARSAPDGGSRPERLRRKLGLTSRQWMVAVSIALFLPYPVFVYVLLTTSVDETLFLAVTFAYSLFAIVANFLL